MDIEIHLGKKQLIKAGILAGVVIIIVVLSALVSGFGYKGPVKASVGLVNSKAADFISYGRYSMPKSQYRFLELNDELAKGNKDKSDKDNVNDTGDESYGVYVESLVSRYGEDYKIKYKIAKADKLDGETFLSLSKDISEYYASEAAGAKETLGVYEDMWNEYKLDAKAVEKLKKYYEKYISECEDIKITEAYKLQLTCTIKGSESRDDFEIEGIIVAKVNGKWIMVEGMVNPYTVLNGIIN